MADTDYPSVVISNRELTQSMNQAKLVTRAERATLVFYLEYRETPNAPRPQTVKLTDEQASILLQLEALRPAAQ